MNVLEKQGAKIVGDRVEHPLDDKCPVCGNRPENGDYEWRDRSPNGRTKCTCGVIYRAVTHTNTTTLKHDKRRRICELWRVNEICA